MMTLADYKILFKNGHPIMPAQLTSCINNFGKSYNATVRNIIQNSEELNEATFKYNAAKLLINFKMVRKGPFHGLKINDSQEVHDPKGNLKSCWEATKNDLLSTHQIIKNAGCHPRTRTLVLLDQFIREEVVSKIWSAFKKMLPITMGKYSYGLVGASKILFSVLPEIVLPLDNAQWLFVVKTVDLGDVINRMADEIIAWENETGFQLQDCDKEKPQFTLPAVYNVMAMEARP